jgi:hypothetical protein
MTNFPFNDTLCGTERYKHSLDYGEVVCPKISIWRTPARYKIIGQANHGDDVEVLGRRKGRGGTEAYRVRVKSSGLTGWVSRPFLEIEGS